MDATRCNRKGDCQDGVECLTHHLWMDLSDQIHAFLTGISLSQLIGRREIRDVADRQDRETLNRIDALLAADGPA
jgi:Rrf2 family iron-sulfur cluster assembly transcriptional regulator